MIFEEGVDSFSMCMGQVKHETVQLLERRYEENVKAYFNFSCGSRCRGNCCSCATEVNMSLCLPVANAGMTISPERHTSNTRTLSEGKTSTDKSIASHEDGVFPYETVGQSVSSAQSADGANPAQQRAGPYDGGTVDELDRAQGGDPNSQLSATLLEDNNEQKVVNVEQKCAPVVAGSQSSSSVLGGKSATKNSPAGEKALSSLSRGDHLPPPHDHIYIADYLADKLKSGDDFSQEFIDVTDAFPRLLDATGKEDADSLCIDVLSSRAQFQVKSILPRHKLESQQWRIQLAASQFDEIFRYAQALPGTSETSFQRPERPAKAVGDLVGSGTSGKLLVCWKRHHV